MSKLEKFQVVVGALMDAGRPDLATACHYRGEDDYPTVDGPIMRGLDGPFIYRAVQLAHRGSFSHTLECWQRGTTFCDGSCEPGAA